MQVSTNGYFCPFFYNLLKSVTITEWEKSQNENYSSVSTKLSYIPQINIYVSYLETVNVIPTICQHNRRGNSCDECKKVNTSICEHNKSSCKECKKTKVYQYPIFITFTKEDIRNDSRDFIPISSDQYDLIPFMILPYTRFQSAIYQILEDLIHIRPLIIMIYDYII